jgi:predicted nucleic acid-binding protein
MSVLEDTNVLLRMAEPTHPQSQTAHRATETVAARGELTCVVPQVLYEFRVASTRPIEQNGLGFTSTAAAAEIAHIESIFTLPQDTDGIFQVWKSLVTKHDVKGKPAHDAHLVAAMTVHGIPAILTFDTQDFVRFTNIRVLSPRDVVASPPAP